MRLSPLAVKQALAGTLPGRLLERARWLAGAKSRADHPELWDMYLEPERIRVAMTALIKADSNCVDVGAHVGTTLAELSRLAPEGHHVAVEAVPAKAESIKQRFQQVRVINAAVADEAGTAMLYEARNSGFSSLRRPVDQEVAAQFPVDVVRLDAVIESKVDFIKLDVEGGELPALIGAQEILDRDRPIVLFECGPNGSTGAFDYQRADLFGFFSQRGYSVYSIADFVYGRPAMTVEEFEKAGHYPYPGFNYLALRPDDVVTRLL